jgi:hypothetical protein
MPNAIRNPYSARPGVPALADASLAHPTEPTEAPHLRLFRYVALQ